MKMKYSITEFLHTLQWKLCHSKFLPPDVSLHFHHCHTVKVIHALLPLVSDVKFKTGSKPFKLCSHGINVAY